MKAIYKNGLLWQDYQHSQLLACISSLNKTRDTESELTELKKTVTFLEFYTKTHFEIEAHYMEVLAYPDTDRHKKAHEDFEHMVAGFKAELNSAKDSSTLITDLCGWIKDHILKSDKKLAAFIKNQAKY